MGRSKHYKMGKTKPVFIPEAIAPEILELVRLLDTLDKPRETVELLKTIVIHKNGNIPLDF